MVEFVGQNQNPLRLLECVRKEAGRSSVLFSFSVCSGQMFNLFIKGCRCSKPRCFNYRIKAFPFSSRWQSSWSGACFSLQLGSSGTQSPGSARTGQVCFIQAFCSSPSSDLEHQITTYIRRGRLTASWFWIPAGLLGTSELPAKAEFPSLNPNEINKNHLR